jgi:hypothetical protein
MEELKAKRLPTGAMNAVGAASSRTLPQRKFEGVSEDENQRDGICGQVKFAAAHRR